MCLWDRHLWRSALENGQYELLNEENKENGIIKTVNEDAEEMEIDEHYIPGSALHP